MQFRSFAYVLWFLILCLWVFACVSECVYLSICVCFLCFFFLSLDFSVLFSPFWLVFILSCCCCYLDASLCSNERRWSGESHNQNILYERKTISNLKSGRKMSFKVRAAERNCLCCFLIVLIKLHPKHYLAPKPRPVPATFVILCTVSAVVP